jgi:4-hydroxybenzoate polyprenyltransferase
VSHEGVSSIRGRYQGPVLRRTTEVVLVLSLLASVLPGRAARDLAVTVVALVVATPLLRLTWLLHRWRQERDRRFVLVGCAVLLVVGVGALVALADLGGLGRTTSP